MWLEFIKRDRSVDNHTSTSKKIDPDRRISTDLFLISYCTVYLGWHWPMFADVSFLGFRQVSILFSIQVNQIVWVNTTGIESILWWYYYYHRILLRTILVGTIQCRGHDLIYIWVSRWDSLKNCCSLWEFAVLKKVEH